MVNESIDRIKKVEEEVKDLLKKAQIDADRIIREAREQAEKIIQDAKKQASEESKVINKDAELEAEKEIALLREKNQTEIDNLRSIAGSNISKAASFIIGRIIG